MSRWLKLPTRKQLRRVLRASERAIAARRPPAFSPATQKLVNQSMRAMLDNLVDGPWLKPRPIRPSEPGQTIQFRRYGVPSRMTVEGASSAVVPRAPGLVLFSDDVIKAASRE